MDLNKHIQSPMRRTSSWGFVGYYESKGKECSFPIGVFTKYCDGVAQANAWMRQEKRAIRWEGEALYEELGDE